MSNGVKQGGGEYYLQYCLRYTLINCQFDLKILILGVVLIVVILDFGALSYADDLTLSCPSIRGLNRMLEICNSFAAEHNITQRNHLGLSMETQFVLVKQFI